jgi:hypothetical protein
VITNSAFLGNEFRRTAPVVLVGSEASLESRDNFADGAQGSTLVCPFAASFATDADFTAAMNFQCIDFDADENRLDLC